MEEILNNLAKRMIPVRERKLEIEVIAYALQAMKEDNKLSIEMAFECGCSEWDV